MPKSRIRHKPKRQRARKAQATQEVAEAKKAVSPRAYARRRIMGWLLVVAGIGVFITHFMEHLLNTHFFPAWISEAGLGFPMALLLGILGVIVLTR